MLILQLEFPNTLFFVEILKLNAVDVTTRLTINYRTDLTNMSEKISNDVKEGTFAEAILETYGPLNNNEKFKEKYADKSFKILLNPKDGKFAALITINNGTVSIKGIENQDKKNLDQQELGWDGFMQTTLALFDEIGKGNLSQSDIVKKVVSRKIKMKNVKIVAKLSEMGALLN